MNLRFNRVAAAAALAVGSVLCVASSSATTLDELEKRAPRQEPTLAQTRALAAELEAFIETDTLKSGDDFLRAAFLARMAVSPAAEFRGRRVVYELLLAALALGKREAAAQLPEAWDLLMMSLGRGDRLERGFGALQMDLSSDFVSEPAPSVVRAIWRDAEAVRTAAKAKNNPELEDIMRADQAARKEWSELTPQQMAEIGQADRKRYTRTCEIVAAGTLATKEDFANASLILQHGETFTSYRLAHELAVCSLLLGDEGTGRWLVAATYDRMLNAAGHEQRYATQWIDDSLMDVDTRGICDAERVALGCGGMNKVLGDSLVRKAEQLVAEGKFDEAVTAARAGLERRTKAYPADAWQVHSAGRILGAALLGQKNYDEAEAVLIRAHEGLAAQESAIPSPYKARIAEAATLLANLYAETAKPEKEKSWCTRAAPPLK
jgi:hypothetical protein